MIGVGAVYVLMGLIFAAVAVSEALEARDAQRVLKAAFWGLVSVSFLFGDLMGDLWNGALLIALALLAAGGRLRRRPPPAILRPPPAPARALFAAALTIPLVTLLGSLVLSRMTLGVRPLIDPKQATPISLALGMLSALALCLSVFRPRPSAAVVESARLLDTIGWAALLPQSLAALGAVFAMAGVGASVGGLIGQWLPMGDPLAAVCAYTVGMAAFTAVMGNAFAAFPVMAGAVGWPVLVQRFGADPAVVGAVGMLAGFCGTLITPMAANFNLVPAALLELRGRYGVIRAQAPTAAALLICNTLILYVAGFGGRHGL